MDYNVFNKPAEEKPKGPTPQSTRELQPARDYKPRHEGQGGNFPHQELGGKPSYRDEGGHSKPRGGYRGGYEGGQGRGGYQDN